MGWLSGCVVVDKVRVIIGDAPIKCFLLHRCNCFVCFFGSSLRAYVQNNSWAIGVVGGN